MSSDIVQKLRLAAAVILSTDGDRDWSNQSNLLVEEALAAANELKQSADTIEALEGEVAAYSKLSEKEAAFGLSQMKRAKAAEARAERLRVALEEAVTWMNGCAVSGGYPAWHAKAIKALEDDKQ